MTLEIIADFDVSALNRVFDAASMVSVKAAKKASKEAARGFLKRVIEITPPASAGKTGLAARRAGERRIDGDLKTIFAPMVLRNKRSELHPDLEAIYDATMANRKGRGAPRLRQRYYVDIKKFKTLRDKLIAHVGFLASGWNSAAEAQGVRVPAWVKRHGSGNGRFRVQDDERGVLIVLTNAIKYSGDVDGYPRRVQAALDYQAAAMLRQLDFLIQEGMD